MKLADRLRTRARSWLGITPPASPARAPGPPREATSGVGHVATSGRRYRLSEDNPTINYLQGLTILAPLDSEHRWRNLNLDEGALDRLSTHDVEDLLADLSPEISNALWHYVRLCNPGYEVHAYKVGGKSDVVDKVAQAALEKFLYEDLRALYGTTDLQIDRLFINAFLRGAFMAELVLDNAGKRPLDLALPDPQWTYFRIALDQQRGPIWQPYQFQHGRPVPLVLETIRYIPIDPRPASPYGRSMIQPAIFTTLFAISLLHDLKRVIQQQGYPRIDVALNLEELAKSMPASLPDDPKAFQNWVDEVILETGKAYAALQPDDAFVHTDNMTIGRPVGTLGADALGKIDAIMIYLDRQAVRALKTMPLLMGINEASSETHANRQWEVFVAGVKSHQHTAEQLLEHLLTLALRAQGLQARVEFRFGEVRAAELLRDAQVEAAKIANAALAYARGFVSQDEAAMMAVGKAKADSPAPRIDSAGITGGGGGAPPPNPNQVAAEPGSQKSVILEGTRQGLSGYVLPDEAFQAASDAWDGALPEAAGLLEATVKTEERMLVTNGNGRR